MRVLWSLWLACVPVSLALKGGALPPLSTESDSQTVILTEDFYCPDYSSYAYQNHTPPSLGRYQLSYQRPAPPCRKFNLSEVEETIQRMRRDIRDPDLFRLFENCFPNTLDTAIAWKGKAKGKHGRWDEEVCPPLNKSLGNE